MKAPPLSPRIPPKARSIFIFVFTEEFCHFQSSRMDFCCPLFLFPFFFILSFSLCRFALLSLGGEFTSQYPAQPCTELQKLNWMSIHNSEKFSCHASLIIVSTFLIIPIEQAIVNFFLPHPYSSSFILYCLSLPLGHILKFSFKSGSSFSCINSSIYLFIDSSAVFLTELLFI